MPEETTPQNTPASTPQSPPSTNPQNSPFNRKNLTQALLLLAAFIAVVGGIWYWQSSRNEQPTPEQTAITNFEECIAAGNPAMESYPRQCRSDDGQTFTEEIDDMANWQTYRNDEFGFEIMYPPTWKVGTLDAFPAISIYKEGEPPFSHHPNATQVSILPQGLGSEASYGESKLVSQNLTGAEELKEIEFFLSNNGEARGFFITFIDVPNNWESYGYVWGGVEVQDYSLEEETVGGEPADYPLLLVKGSVDSQEQQTIQQILSTFRFIDTAVTSSWQTYRNDQYGFEFKYPADWHFKAGSYNSSLTLSLDPPEVSPSSHLDTDLPYAIRLTVYSDIIQLDWRNQSLTGLDDFINKYSKPPVEGPNIVLGPYIQDVEIISQGNISWYKAKAGPNVFGGGEFYFTEDGDNIYEIKLFNLVGPDWTYADVFDQILSTFRFVE